MLCHQSDRVVQHGILVGVQLLRLNIGGQLQQLLLERGLALLSAGLDDAPGLVLGDVGALHTQHLGRAERLVEHVPCAQQRLGAVHVQDHARVGLRRHGEGDP